ncbi:MAG: NPCBM/NEW2 domain-containing protein [Gemmataceae bacterium]
MHNLPTFFLTFTLAIGQTDAEWQISTTDGVQTSATLPAFDFSKLIALRRLDKAVPEWPTEPHAILANGDRIVGTLTSADARSITIENRYLGKINIPLTALSAIWNKTLPAGTPLDPMKSDWLGDRKTDAILFSNRDIQRGTIERIGDDSAVWLKQAGGMSRKFDAEKIVAVGFSAGLSRMRTPKIAHAAIVLADGSRITIDAIVAYKKSLGIGTVTGGKGEIPESALISLDVLEGKAVYLADIKPKSSKTEPALGLIWPLVNNRSAKGNPLRIGSNAGIQTFERGIGTHARSTVEYDLAGKYRRFEAVVGMDATTGLRGRVGIRILLDGKPQAIAGLADLRAELGQIPFSIDTTNVKTLTLITDMGPLGDVNADVNWCNARLIRN